MRHGRWFLQNQNNGHQRRHQRRNADNAIKLEFLQAILKRSARKTGPAIMVMGARRKLDDQSDSVRYRFCKSAEGVSTRLQR